MAQFLQGKTVACSVFGKNLKHFEKRLLKMILFWRSCCFQMFIKEVFLRISQNSQESTCTGVSFWWSYLLPAYNLIKKGTSSQMFSCKLYDIFKNNFFIKGLGATASESSSQVIIIKTSKWHQLRQYFWQYCQLSKCFCLMR